MLPRAILNILLVATFIPTAKALRFVRFTNAGAPLFNSKREITEKPNRSIFDYEYRLPKTFVPNHYKLKLTFDAEKKEIKGRVIIDLKVLEPSDYLVMHADPDYISNITGKVQMGPVETRNLHPLMWNKTRQTVMVEWPVASQNTTWRIDANFTTHVVRGYSPNGIFTKEGRYAAFLEMYGARKIMPCFDEPQLKAKFEVEIELKNFWPNVTVVSNTMGEQSANVWSFAETPRMSTYLLVFAIGDYTPVCLDTGPAQQCGTKLLPGQSDKVCHWLEPRYIKDKEKAMQYNKFGLATYCSLQKYLNIQHGVGLSFVVDVMQGSAALEDWGLVYIGWVAFEFEFKETYAHEIIHYWFGDLVSPSSWPHLWLSESFATFFSTLSDVTMHYDNDTIAKQEDEMQRNVERFKNHTHINHTVVDEVWANDYGTKGISIFPYDKGALIIKMLHDVIGEKCFKTALRNYMKIKAFQNADTNELLSSFQKSVNLYKVKGWEEEKLLDVKTFMNPFLYKSGIPKVKITKSGALEVSVKKIVPKGQKAEDWPLPLWAFHTETKENKKYRIVNETTALVVPGKHIEWNKYHYAYATVIVRG